MTRSRAALSPPVTSTSWASRCGRLMPRPWASTADAYDGLEELLSEHAEEVMKEPAAEHPASDKVTEYRW
jgi:hypothetical protein